MPTTASMQALEQPAQPSLYAKSELVGLRRNVLLYARSCPPGFDRNQHRQIARSLRNLFNNARWLAEHSLEGLGDQERLGDREGLGDRGGLGDRDV